MPKFFLIKRFSSRAIIGIALGIVTLLPVPCVADEIVLQTPPEEKQQQPFTANIQELIKDVPLKPMKLGILPEESKLYYHLLDTVRGLDSNQIQRTAKKFMTERWKQSRFKHRPFESFPAFLDIYKHPEKYQGKPVTLRGHFQRTVRSSATKNDSGIENVCECWLFTKDSQNHPTVIVTTELPEGLPIGEQIVNHVTVTGYLYRMYVYRGRDKIRYAPLLIAHEVKWDPDRFANQKEESAKGFLILIGGILIAGVLFGLVFRKIQVKNQRGKESVAERLNNVESSDLF